MKRMSLVVMGLMVYASLSFGQLTFLPNDISKTKSHLPDKIREIRQYDGDKLLNVRYYDELKNMVFSHYKQYVSERWNGNYLTMIDAYSYDEKGRIEKMYVLHSNTGFTVYYYEYDDIFRVVKTYSRTNRYDIKESQINQNPYKYIDEIKNVGDLIKHKKIRQMEEKGEKRLLSIETYDSIGNLLKDLSFDENGDTSRVLSYKYDENNNKIYSCYEQPNDNGWESYYEYEKEIFLFERDIELKGRPSNLIQSVRVSYNKNTQTKKIGDIRFYKYDDLDRLVEEVYYARGEFQSKVVYDFNDFGKVFKEKSYIYDPNQTAVLVTYLYNREGYVINKRTQDFRSGEKTKNEVYRYEYEYYK